MNFNNLESVLRKITEKEEQYQKNSQLSDYYNTLEKQTINGKSVYIFDNLIPIGQSFNILKHNRFVPVPPHIHNFIELNYIYSGECRQVIDGKLVKLTQGQICLIDTAVPHSIENTSGNDIIINILVKKDYFSKQLSQEKMAGGIVFDFVLNALSERQTHNQYIVFKNKKDEQIRLTIQQILLENLYPSIGSPIIIENLISILFTLLVRDFDYETNKKQTNGKEQIVAILQHIENNYLNVSLSQLADIFNYTPTYLSALIRKETSKNFSEIVLEKKLKRAHMLIKNTSDPINICASEAGFTNITFFYKKYKEYYGRNPGEKTANA